ncbi:MAG: tetratricopeptide repeat protein [Parachlamydiaceae bacterium]|nr:tetratricopeptide repeat protein [Parachlamydiaceae bacterium]
MTEEKSLFLDKLQENYTARGFEVLEPFKDSSSWGILGHSDREILGQLFVLRGEELFNSNDPKASDLLEKAMKISPNSCKVLHSAVKVYMGQGLNNVRYLSAALRAIEHGLTVHHPSFELHHSFVQALLRKGALIEDENYFIRANEVCKELVLNIDSEEKNIQARFFWDWGKILFYLGKNSGEAVDFYEARVNFCMAKSLGLEDPEFLKDEGDIHFELAELLGRESLYLEAIECYQNSLKISHDSLDAWYSLGLCYMLLYDNDNDQKFFFLADTSFSNAAKVDSNHLMLWFKWGQLQLDYGKQYDDVDILASCVEKFAKANSIQANHPDILCCWGEGIMLVGTLTEQISLLKAAEKKIAASAALQPENDHVWHLYGCCFNELGRYFNNESMYLEAIGKFLQGLAINKNSVHLWHGLAYSHFAIGELKGDIALIEKACNFCAKAMENGAISQPQCWNDWGVALMKIGELTHDKVYAIAALEKFENAMNLQSSLGVNQECDSELVYNYGCALDFLGDFSDDPIYYEKAIVALQKVLTNEPSHPHARYNLALALSHLGELIADAELLEKAVEQFEMVIENDFEDEMAWNECGLTHINLAQIIFEVALPHKSQKCFEQAEEKLQKAVTLGCSQAYYNLACFHSLTGNCEAGMFYLEKAEIYNSLPSLNEIMQDDWLASLRQMPAFQSFLSNWKQKNVSGR